jgi:hypothetical protein
MRKTRLKHSQIPEIVAQDKANEWVSSELGLARDTSLNDSDRIKNYGNAMHTIQDYTDPVHTDFQPWFFDYTLGKIGNFPSALHHLTGEDFDPGKGSHLDGATLKAWNLFISSNKFLPSNVFDGLGFDQPSVYRRHHLYFR